MELTHYAKGKTKPGAKYKNRYWRNGHWVYVYDTPKSASLEKQAAKSQGYADSTMGSKEFRDDMAKDAANLRAQAAKDRMKNLLSRGSTQTGDTLKKKKRTIHTNIGKNFLQKALQGGTVTVSKQKVKKATDTFSSKGKNIVQGFAKHTHVLSNGTTVEFSDVELKK